MRCDDAAMSAPAADNIASATGVIRPIAAHTATTTQAAEMHTYKNPPNPIRRPAANAIVADAISGSVASSF